VSHQGCSLSSTLIPIPTLTEEASGKAGMTDGERMIGPHFRILGSDGGNFSPSGGEP